MVKDAGVRSSTSSASATEYGGAQWGLCVTVFSGFCAGPQFALDGRELKFID